MRTEFQVSGDLHFTPLPRPNRHLTALAVEAAACAAALLPARSGLFLGLERNAAGEIVLTWWRDDFRVAARLSAHPEGFCPEDSDEGLLQHAAHDLLEYLAGRWAMPPGQFGVITDGVGIAFSVDDPAPSAPGWLMRHATGNLMLHSIVPLNAAGPCGLFRYGNVPSIH